jgi:murein DD-endopeptidase MepM/ murein hydrolase activator NlpD
MSKYLLSSYVGIWAIGIAAIVSIPKDILGQAALSFIGNSQTISSDSVIGSYKELMNKFTVLEKQNQEVLNRVSELEEVYQSKTEKLVLDSEDEPESDSVTGVGGLEQRYTFTGKKMDDSFSLVLSEDLSVVSGYPISSGIISSSYGERKDPFSQKTRWHSGTDIAAKQGSKIFSTGDGLITFAGERGHYGMLVEVQHSDGYTTRYAHCKELLVSVGDTVKKGQSIALVGSTGRSTGPHVHYEVAMNGKTIDPVKLMYR